jgi:hypothetical protein
MLWGSTLMMLFVTLFAWWYAGELKANKEYARLSTFVYAAVAIGAIGTVCFLIAALL